MVSIRTINPVLRATGVIAAVAVLVSSVTFAALQSQATLMGNTISSTTANLLVGLTTDNMGGLKQGFNITNLVPGTGATETFYLDNNGTSNLDISVQVTNASGITGVTYADVPVVFDSGACASPVETNMQALIDNPVELTCNALVGTNGPRPYTAKFDIDPTAISGGSVSVGAFDLVFSGIQEGTVVE